jgi:hypothetical protein
MHDIHYKSGSFGLPASIDCDSCSMSKIDKLQWHRYCSHIKEKEPPTIISATGSQADRERRRRPENIGVAASGT